MSLTRAAGIHDRPRTKMLNFKTLERHPAQRKFIPSFGDTIEGPFLFAGAKVLRK
jgi:hypothetical protein